MSSALGSCSGIMLLLPWRHCRSTWQGRPTLAPWSAALRYLGWVRILAMVAQDKVINALLRSLEAGRVPQPVELAAESLSTSPSPTAWVAYVRVGQHEYVVRGGGTVEVDAQVQSAADNASHVVGLALQPCINRR